MSIEIKFIKNPFNGHRLVRYINVGLPPLTIRAKYRSGKTPRIPNTDATVTAVEGMTDVYDICTSGKVGGNWYGLLLGDGDLLEFLDANTEGVTNVKRAFTECNSVQGGAYMMYQKFISMDVVPEFDKYTFHECGSSTMTGSADLAQIPVSWGGFKFSRATFIDNTSNTQVLSFGERIYRVQFMVLPNTSYTSQLATCNNGISTGSGVSVFWVTEYSIDPDGALHVKGRKANYDFTRANSNSGWPTLNSSTMYYYGSQSFDGVYSEAHKFGVGVPSDAVAVLLAYKNQTEEQITCHTMETDRVYNNITDVLCGMCKDITVLNSIATMGTGVAATFDIAGSNMIYPLQSNRTILCGPREFLTSL